MVLELLQCFLHPVGNFDDVSTGCLGDAEGQRLLAVNAVDPVLLRPLIGNLGDVAQPQLVLGIDHGVGDLLDVLKAAHRTHIDLLAALNHPAPGDGEVLGAQAVEHLEHVDPVAVYLALVQLDDHLLTRRSPKLDVADPIDAAQRRLHVGVNELARVGVLGLKGDRAFHDRNVVLIPAPDPQLLDFVGQLGHDSVEPVLHLGKSQLQVGALLELDLDIAAAAVGVGANSLDPADLGDGLFEVMHDLLLHFDRSGVGIVRPSEEAGIVKASGKKGQGDPRVGDVAHH